MLVPKDQLGSHLWVLSSYLHRVPLNGISWNVVAIKKKCPCSSLPPMAPQKGQNLERLCDLFPNRVQEVRFSFGMRSHWKVSVHFSLSLISFRLWGCQAWHSNSSRGGHPMPPAIATPVILLPWSSAQMTVALAGICAVGSRQITSQNLHLSCFQISVAKTSWVTSVCHFKLLSSGEIFITQCLSQHSNENNVLY